MINLSKYHNIHKDKTIFVLGNSEELNSITEDQLYKLENDYITVGTNYSHMVVRSDYLITGHMSHVLYAREFGNIDKILFQTKASNPVWDSEPLVDTIPCSEGGVVTRTPTTVIGCANIGISSAHLAFILGGSRVVFVGFNQKNLLHFYDTDPEHKEALLSNIDTLKGKYKGDFPGALFADYDSHISHMQPGPESLTKSPWTSRSGNPNNTVIITSIVTAMKDADVEVLSTCEESVMVDGGAIYRSLDDIIGST